MSVSVEQLQAKRASVLRAHDIVRQERDTARQQVESSEIQMLHLQGRAAELAELIMEFGEDDTEKPQPAAE